MYCVMRAIRLPEIPSDLINIDVIDSVVVHFLMNLHTKHGLQNHFFFSYWVVGSNLENISSGFSFLGSSSGRHT